MKVLLQLMIFIFCAQLPAKNTHLIANKTIKDTLFKTGDIIAIPELIYQLSYPLSKETVDSILVIDTFLNLHPELIVEIGCHTDQRGSDKMNEELSQYRAKAVWNYMIFELGNDSTRLTYKGYGESKLIYSDEFIESLPTQEEKEFYLAQNMRTELKVLGVKR